jgi:hypothetical protein
MATHLFNFGFPSRLWLRYLPGHGRTLCFLENFVIAVIAALILPTSISIRHPSQSFGFILSSTIMLAHCRSSYLRYSSKSSVGRLPLPNFRRIIVNVAKLVQHFNYHFVVHGWVSGG